ncbi:MAG: hypothetical protein J6U50_00855, partial [Lachnospiraceae bacterium]|nr:hypothetical protein [Lachnospiraceae bacterium]
LAAVIAIMLLIPVIRRAVLYIRIMSMKKNGRYSEALLSRYRSYTGRLLKKKIIKSSNTDTMILAAEIAEALQGDGISGASGNEHEAFVVAGVVRKAAFSGKEITAEEYTEACEVMARILKTEPAT